MKNFSTGLRSDANDGSKLKEVTVDVDGNEKFLGPSTEETPRGGDIGGEVIGMLVVGKGGG